MLDPPPSPRGDLPTPEVYKRSPRAKSPMGIVEVEARKNETSLSFPPPPPPSLGADAVQEGSPEVGTEVDDEDEEEVEKRVEEGGREEEEEMVGVVVEGGP